MRKKNLYSPGMHDRFVDARGPLLRVTAQEQTDVFCPATVFPTIRQKMTTVSWQLSGGAPCVLLFFCPHPAEQHMMRITIDK